MLSNLRMARSTLVCAIPFLLGHLVSVVVALLVYGPLLLDVPGELLLEVVSRSFHFGLVLAAYAIEYSAWLWGTDVGVTPILLGGIFGYACAWLTVGALGRLARVPF